jgi:hypothetical protein
MTAGLQAPSAIGVRSRLAPADVREAIAMTDICFQAAAANLNTHEEIAR